MEPNTRPQLQFLEFDEIEDTGEAAYLQSLLYSVGSPRLLLPWSESTAPVHVQSTEWPAPNYELTAAEMGAGEGEIAASGVNREDVGGEPIFRQVSMPVVTTMQQLYHPAHPAMPPMPYMHPASYHPHFQQAHPMYSSSNPTVSAASVTSPAGGRRIPVNNSGTGPHGGHKHSPKRRPDQAIASNGGSSPQYPPSGAQPPPAAYSPQLHHPAMAYQYISPAGPPPNQAVIPSPQHAAGQPVYLAASHLPMYPHHMYSFAPVPPHPHQPPMYPPQQQAPIVPQNVAPLNGGTVNVADEAPKVIEPAAVNYAGPPESTDKGHRIPHRQPSPPTKPPQPQRVSPIVNQQSGITKSLPPQTAIKTTAPPALPPVVKRNRTSESDSTQSPPPSVQQHPAPPPVEHVPEPIVSTPAPQEIPSPPVVVNAVLPTPAPVPPPIKSFAAVLKNTSADITGLGSGDHHVSVVTRTPGVPGSGPPQSAMALSTPSLSLKPPAPVTSSTSVSSQSSSASPIDPTLKRLGVTLSSYQLEHRAIILTPRGLTNPSNYCYINATLQALLACPPFYNLIKFIANVKDEKKPPLVPQKSRTPIIDSMVKFISEFSQATQSRLLLVRKEKLQARKESPDVGANVDIVSGPPFEPTFIYQMLRKMRTEDSFHEEGRQEDAEEFLSFLLNGLNDEMLDLQKLVNETTTPIVNGDVTANGESHNDDEMLWKEMTNKGSRLTRRAELERTPLSDIFRGQLRSSVHRPQAESTDNVQPFFTLQLDTESSSSVEEALEKLVMVDQLEAPDSTGAVSTQQTLDQLPCVLILHLKCFHYRQQTPSKIMKALKFPVDLKLDQKLLSTKSKSAAKGRHFKLFAVVYHDGKEATKGHYLADVFHVGTGGWIRYDDGNVQPVSVEQVQSPKPPTVPYLLYYRRTDTIAHPRSV